MTDCNSGKKFKDRRLFGAVVLRSGLKMVVIATDGGSSYDDTQPAHYHLLQARRRHRSPLADLFPFQLHGL